MFSKIKYILVFLSVVVRPCLQGQTFDNYYKPGYHNWHSTSVITREDSGFVCANFVLDSATGRDDLNLLWIDNKGVQVKSKTINFFNLSVGFFTSGKNYFNKFTHSSFLMQTGVFKGSNQGVLFIKYDINSLDTVKTSLFVDISNDCAITNFIRFNDNKFYLVGNKWNNTSGKSTPLILHVDSNLNIVSQLAINTPTSYAPTCAVYNKRMHKILLKGRSTAPGIPNIFVHIDTLGMVTQSITSTSSTVDVFNEIEYSDFDSSYLAYAAKVTSKYGGHSLCRLSITKYDHNLNMLWQKTYGDESRNNGLTTLLVLANGDLVASGAYSELTTLPLINENANGVLLKTNKDGNLQWFREYDHQAPGPLVEVFWGLDHTKNGGYVACGSIFAQAKPTGVAWFVKMDSVGCVTPGCPSSVVQVDSFPVPPPITVGLSFKDEVSLIDVYPNPSPGKVRVVFRENVPGEKIIKVSDCLGNCIFSEVISSQSESDVEIKGADGLYFVDILDVNTGARTVRRVMKLNNR